MQSFINFWADFLPVVCEFLLSAPIIWFVGIFVLIFIVSVLKSIFLVTK